MENEFRKSGRYRLNDEDKAKPVPLKLHQNYIERLEFFPGKSVAEKVRYLIDNSCDWRERERRQIKEVKKVIGPLYRLAKTLVDPEVKADTVNFLKNFNGFKNGLKTLETLLEILHFDIKVLKKYLEERDMIELEIIFSINDSLKNTNGLDREN
ncbi:MAG: hypothetical protein K9K67_15860 [Bacteriovoracaceae bacterium]|nr:hypothetical protein [Bacteriovoracaceae bacterium]